MRVAWPEAGFIIPDTPSRPRQYSEVGRTRQAALEQKTPAALSYLKPFSGRTFTPVKLKCRAAFSMWRSFV